MAGSNFTSGNVTDTCVPTLTVVTADDSSFRVTATMDIPIGHKVALTDIKNGDTVWKYGQDIGKAVADIKKGEHVHVHNLKTKRW